jgi:hypothetical protein
MSTDLTCSAQQALQGDSGRWQIEVGNFYLKTQLGLSDFRLRPMKRWTSIWLLCF